MSRYIDADEAEKLLRAGCAYAIWELPSIDIVRCKECKWWHKLHGCIKNDDVNLCTNADDFCSYGERKESE